MTADETRRNASHRLQAVGVYGVDRVIVCDTGEAWPGIRAFLDLGMRPQVVFVRDDGWTLGAPDGLEEIAYTRWPDHWVGFALHPSTEFRPMEEYQP